jgi:hypothetical protein
VGAKIVDNTENIIVLAGGESVKNFDYKNIDKYGCYVIGVNDAFRYAPVNSVVSMDRLFLENRWDELSKLENKAVFLRYNAYKVNKKPETFHGLHLFECQHDIDRFSRAGITILHGRSSGHCALNLAYSLRPRNV